MQTLFCEGILEKKKKYPKSTECTHFYIKESCTYICCREKIKTLDKSYFNVDEGTYENGCKFLLSWHNSFRQ